MIRARIRSSPPARASTCGRIRRHPPAAAWVDLTVSRAGTGGGGDRIAIPAGTRVVAARGADPQPVVFVTTESTALPAGQDEVTVRVHHYACAQCGSTIYNNEQIIPSEAAEGTAEAATAETEAADEAAAPASES